jgi:hypothetical protein
MFKSGPASTAATFAATLFVALALNWGYKLWLASSFGVAEAAGYDPDVAHILGNVVAIVVVTFIATGLMFLLSYLGARAASREVRVRYLPMVIVSACYGLAFWLLNPYVGEGIWLVAYIASFVLIGPFAVSYVATLLWPVSRRVA